MFIAKHNKKESKSIIGLLIGIIFIIIVIGICILCILEPWKPKLILPNPFSKTYGVVESSLKPINKVNKDFSDYKILLSETSGIYSNFGKKDCSYYDYSILRTSNDGNVTINFNFSKVSTYHYYHYVTLNQSSEKYIHPEPIYHNGEKKYSSFPNYYFNYKVLSLSEGKNNKRIYTIYFSIIEILEDDSIYFSNYQFNYESKDNIIKEDSDGNIYEYFEERINLDKHLHNIFISNEGNHCPFEQYHKEND